MDKVLPLLGMIAIFQLGWLIQIGNRIIDRLDFLTERQRERP